MAKLKPRDFIQSVLIEELEILQEHHPYISFIIMGIGIEFLGKCLDRELTSWNIQIRRPNENFRKAIEEIPSFKRYVPFLDSHEMYLSFRCGLVHTLLPDIKITLSSKNEFSHMVEHDGRLNLKVEDFYKDFKEACEFVINKSYPERDKMNLNFLEVPDNRSFEKIIYDFENRGTDPTGIITPASGSVND